MRYSQRKRFGDTSLLLTLAVVQFLSFQCLLASQFLPMLATAEAEFPAKLSEKTRQHSFREGGGVRSVNEETIHDSQRHGSPFRCCWSM